MRRKRRSKNNNNGAPKWMVTYSDMITLILVFFILLFSMSQIDLVKFEAVSESFKNRMIFDHFPSPVPMENPTENTSNRESGKDSNEFDTPTDLPDVNDKDKDDRLSALVEEIDRFLDEKELHSVITANRTEQGVVLVLQEKILFNSGEAEILPSGKPFLNKIGTLLLEIPNKVKIEGHTDSRPMTSYRYPSNWELSGARASSVIRNLIRTHNFNESRFSLAGYSDTRPLGSNDTEGNMTKNRRVEIVILNEGSDES